MHSDFPYGDPRLSHSLERDHLAPALLWRVRRLRFRFGRGRFHEAADLLRRTSLHIVGDVRIGVERKPCAIVAQHAGQGLHIHAAGEGHRCESVTKLVEATNGHSLVEAENAICYDIVRGYGLRRSLFWRRRVFFHGTKKQKTSVYRNV